MGISYIFSPMPNLEKKALVQFQAALINSGVEFKRAEQTNEHQIMVVRDAPALNINVMMIPPAIGQIIVVSPQPGCIKEMFVKEVEAVLNAYSMVWTAPSQVVHSDATFRDLFEATEAHAFQELWEQRLKQPKQALKPLERPVLGGGLRLVMPSQPEDTIPTQIEVKIESYLQDSRKFFIETVFTWPQPMPSGADLNPQGKIQQLDDYIENSVIVFARGDTV